MPGVGVGVGLMSEAFLHSPGAPTETTDLLAEDGSPLITEGGDNLIQEAAGRPSWLPAEATGGFSVADGEAYLNDTLIAPLSTVWNSATGQAAGALLSTLVAVDYCLVMDFTRGVVGPGEDQFEFVVVTDDFAAATIGLDAGSNGNGESWASDLNGDYNDLPTLTAGVHTLAFSLNAEGVLASIDGATAVLSAPQVSAVGLLVAAIGAWPTIAATNNGTIASCFFYTAGKNAAAVQALAT